MYSLISALARGENFNLKNTGNSVDFGAGDEFSKIFNRAMGGARGGVADIISRLQDRFPNAKVSDRDVPAGIEESKKAADDDGDKKSDKINLSHPLLENMMADGNLAKMIEDVVSGLFEGGDSGNIMNMNGAYVQRSVTITVTTIRYTKMQRSEENGEMLAASEFQTSLQEKIKEMLEQLFGGGDGGGDFVSDESGNNGKAKGKDKHGDKHDGKHDSDAAKGRGGSGGGSVSMWSLEMFYSSSALTAQGAPMGPGEDGYGLFESVSSSVQYSAKFSSFGEFASNDLPSFLSRFMGGDGGGKSGDGGLSGFLEGALGEFGMTSGGYRRVEGGFSFKFSQSRNLIAELMELYGDRIGGKKDVKEDGKEKYDADPAAEADAEVAEEQLAEEVGAAV